MSLWKNNINGDGHREYPTCIYTGKMCYTNGGAVKALNDARKWKHRKKQIPKRMYFCRKCGYWHLTHYLGRKRRRSHGR